MFPDPLETPYVYEIDSRVILYMLKSLDEKSIGRVHPYMRQIELEATARERLFLEINNHFRIAGNQYTGSERCKITHPQEGPLAKMLAHRRQSGYIARLGNFYAVARDLQITRLYELAIDTFMGNLLHFGVSSEVIIHPQFVVNRVATLQALADEGRLLTNEYTPRDGVEPLVIGMDAIQRSITNYSAKEELRERSFVNPLLLEFPAPFTIATSSISKAMEFPIIIKYEQINRHNTVRVAIEFNKREFNVTPIDPSDLRRPDLKLAGLSRITEVYASPREFGACIEPLTMWLGNIQLHMTPVRMLATKNVKTVEIFIPF